MGVEAASCSGMAHAFFNKGGASAAAQPSMNGTPPHHPKCMRSHIPNHNSFCSADSDEDFGEFESVPAHGYGSSTPSTQTLGSHHHLDAFSSLPSSFASCFETARPSVVENDFYGVRSSGIHFMSASQTQHSPLATDALQAALGFGSSPEVRDDDWGDFVDHSVAESRTDSQQFGWLDEPTRFTHMIHTAANDKDGSSELTVGTAKQISVQNVTNVPVAQPALSPPVDLVSDGLNQGYASQTVNKSDTNGFEFECAVAVDFPSLKGHVSEVTDSSFKEIRHSGTNSAIENISAPLPLSFFGEEETNHSSSSEKCGKNSKDHTMIAAKLLAECHSRSTVPNSHDISSDITSGAVNFPDLIDSVHTKPDNEPGVQHFSGQSNSFSLQNYPNSSQGIENRFRSQDKHITWQHSSNADLNSPKNTVVGQKHGLAHRLRELELDFRTFGDSKPNGLVFSSILNKISEHTLGMNLEGITLSQVREVFDKVLINGSINDVSSFETLNWNELSIMLTEEGRIKEALACKAHASALHCLSTLQRAYNAAMESSDQEKIIVLAKEIENAKARVAEPQELHHWQERRTGNSEFGAACKFPSTRTSIKDKFSDKEKLEDCLQIVSNLTIEEMIDLLGKSSSDARAMAFQAEFPPDECISLAKRDLYAAVELHASAVGSFWVLACASAQDQCIFVKAWATMASFCAQELEHALNIWKRAHHSKIHLDLLYSPQGKNYYVAVGQLYGVALILAATATLHKPWLLVAVEEGKMLQLSLKCCEAAWVGTELSEAVRLALHGKGNIMPSLITSWEGLESLATSVQAAVMLAAEFGAAKSQSQNVCGICLLPVLALSFIPSVKLGGQNYLLPLANLWANCNLCEPLRLPSVQLGTIVTA